MITGSSGRKVSAAAEAAVPKTGQLEIKARLSARLLLQCIRRIGVHFARNRLAHFRCLTRLEFFIHSATAKGDNSKSEENETPAFHGEINNRGALDFQRR